jgi:uncharacterized protein YjbI with pentapeptide repeats
MADKKHFAMLRFGVEAWNIWYNPEYRGFADLRGADFSCADLSGINLSGARLQDADLRYADLSGADLRGASFHGAKLDRANLRGARLGDAQGLTRAQVHYADGDETTQLPDDLRLPVHWRDPVTFELPTASVPSGVLT